MRMKKGFTLAEILVTLGIIGVVAALTVPALTKNTGSAKIGPSLAKFVNTFENATGVMMQAEGLITLIDTSSDAIPIAKISENMVVAQSPNSYTYYAPNGGTGGTFTAANTYVLKDGSIFGIAKKSTYSSLSNKGAYKGIIADVIYDINGNGGKNRAGKDVFRFELDNSGALIPYGSAAHKYIDSSITSTCSYAASSAIASAFACTGKIADNGWKAE